ncbi:MAG: RHS repeat-associated core domain-containing protein [Pirellulales bacterium]
MQTIHGAPDADSHGDDWVTTLTYNEFGQVASVRDPRGNVTRHQYDREGNLLSQIDPNGVATYYRYDDKQNLISVKGSTGSAIQIDYDAAGNPTQMVTAMSSGISGDFGGNGGHRQGSGNSGAARGITTQFAFNAFGDVISVIDQDGNQQSRIFDANGNEVESKLKWIDPARPQIQQWIVESQELDGNDQVSKRMAVTGQVRAMMDALQREVEQTDANGLKQDTLYDRRGLIIQTRKQAYRPKEDGSRELIWMVERTLFDERGLPAYTLDSTREGTPTDQQTGQRYSYDAQGRIVKLERLRGLNIAIEGSAGQWKSVLKSTGTVIDATRSEFDDRNRVIRSWDFFGSPTETTYDHWDQVIETRSWVRDELDQLQWQTSRTIYDSVGRVVWQSKPYLTSFTTVAGVSRSGPTMAEHLEYDKQGRVARRYQVSGVIWVWNSNGYAIENPGTILRSESLTYDDAGKLILKSFEDGTLEEYQYDGRGRLVSVMNQAVPSSLVGWDTLYPNQWVRSRTETVYDRNSRVQSTITGVVQVVDSQGKPITIDRSRQRIQSWEYDALGRVVRQIEADGSSIRKEYDPQGNVLAEIDARGRRTEMQYDGRGQMTAIVLPEVTLPNDSTLAKPRWEYEYDGLGNIVSIHANLAQRSTGVIQRDHDGVPGDDMRTTRLIYDDVGHLIERILPSGDRERLAYDPRGRESTRHTLQGTVERSVYDDRPGSGGRLVAKEYFADESSYRSGVDQPEQRVRYRYDAWGRLNELRAEQWSSVRNDWDLQSFQRWQYDAEGRVIEENSPSGSLYHRYDTIGRRIQLIAGTAATEAENALHPLLDVRYAYDRLGRLGEIETRVRDGISVDTDPLQSGAQPEKTAYFYDDLGRVRRIELPNQLVELVTYDDRDRIAKIEHLQRNRVGAVESTEWMDRFEYRYREDGKRVQAIESFTYDHDDNAATPRMLRTSTTLWNYDDLGRLIEERVDDSDDRMDRTETIRWDLVGNRIEKRIDYVQASLVDEAIRSLYDGQDRLLTESIDRGMNGSIEQTIRYQWDATQLVGKQVFEGVSSEPSARRARQAWSYDARGLLKTSDVENGVGTHWVRTDWSYDPMGNRQSMTQWEDRDANLVLSESEKLGEKHWWVDRKNPTGHAQEILEQVESAEGRIVQWVTTVFGLDETSQTKSPWDADAKRALSTETRVLLHDARGSVRRTVGTAASSNESYDYGAFGEMVRMRDSHGDASAERAGRGNQALEGVESEAWTTLLYAGESFESTLGWQYLRARWMDPLTGRMSRLDPVFGDRSDPLSFHKYAYTHGDPILHHDPTGKFEGLIGMMANIGIRMAVQSIMFEFAKTLHMQWNQPIKPIPAQQIARDWVYGKLASGSYIAAESNGEIDELDDTYGFVAFAPHVHRQTGFRALLFANQLSQERVLSYAGTDDFPDVVTDVWQGILGGTVQYQLAVDTFASYANRGLTPHHVVGHSLGGGLASTVSIVYGVRGTTFNGAGVHPHTVGLHNKTLDGADALINAYRV